jgi:pimeloyl-ACP methyl ester carboxylesterase
VRVRSSAAGRTIRHLTLGGVLAEHQFEVVFVHGFLSSSSTWNRFIELLEADRELAAFHATAYEYTSRLVELKRTRRLPSIDDIADGLESYLDVSIPGDVTVILVSHSQGGLVVQRFLARTLARGQGHRLARIRSIVMFSCPNSGSNFAIGVRRAAIIWRNVQENELRPLKTALLETQATVLNQVIHATSITSSTCPIPIHVYAGASDQIVPPATARGSFPSARTIRGDHFDIIQPANESSESYRAVKMALTEVGRNRSCAAGADHVMRRQTPESPAGSANTASPNDAQNFQPERSDVLSIVQRTGLIELVLNIPGMLDPQFRQELYNSLPVPVLSHVRRHPDPKVEILGLIQTFQRIPNLKPWQSFVSGLTALLPPEQPEGKLLTSRLRQLGVLS